MVDDFPCARSAIRADFIMGGGKKLALDVLSHCLRQEIILGIVGKSRDVVKQLIRLGRDARLAAGAESIGGAADQDACFIFGFSGF